MATHLLSFALIMPEERADYPFWKRELEIREKTHIIRGDRKGAGSWSIHWTSCAGGLPLWQRDTG
jgi:hypothetical protein